VSDELIGKDSGATASDSLPQGVTQLVESALRSPSPRPEAETAAQERAQAAYQEALQTPRPLHADPWHPAPGSLTARLAQFLRRLWKNS
jgi:hypothetical protein